MNGEIDETSHCSHLRCELDSLDQVWINGGWFNCELKTSVSHRINSVAIDIVTSYCSIKCLLPVTSNIFLHFYVFSFS